MYNRILVLVPVLVRVPEYLSMSKRTSTITFELTIRVQYEYQEFSTRVLRVRVPSTSTPALVPKFKVPYTCEHGQQIKRIVNITPTRKELGVNQLSGRRHQIETFSALLDLVRGIHRCPNRSWVVEIPIFGFLPKSCYLMYDFRKTT